MSFKDIALPLAARGIPVIPLGSNSKKAYLKDWQNLASTDPTQIEKWDASAPDSNCGCVAKAVIGGFWFLELDAAGEALRIKNETQKDLPQTLLIRSRAGRGHLYFKQNAASIAMGNITQPQVKGAGFSIRVNNEYVVAPGSIHPATGLPYTIVEDAPMVECPDWLIGWILSQRVAATERTVESGATGPILSGSRNSALASIAGKFRAAGMSDEGIREELHRINEERCDPPLPEDEVDSISRSIARYAQGDPNPQVLFGGLPGGLARVPVVDGSSAPADEPGTHEGIGPDLEEPEPVFSIPHPVFPEWVMWGTSVYEGMVKPWCAVNTRYPEYMFLPAMAILLNYVGLRVRIAFNHFIPALHMVLIGRKGAVIKSSSVETAMEYFKGVGMADEAKSNGTADGRVLIWTAGSPEGLGLDMERKGCKNALLFYDELRGLVAKANIENSTMIDALLKTYESGKYSNVVTGRKNTFSFEPKSYCLSFIACTTDKSFRKQWSTLGGEASGLNDRFFFLYQPPVLITPPLLKTDVNTQAAALITRKLVDKAVDREVYEFDAIYKKQLQDASGAYSNRQIHRAERFALYFAIDLGRDEIDGDCVERALALIEYEQAVKKFLRIGQSDAENPEARTQGEIRFQLQQNNGTMLWNDLFKRIGQRIGTSAWEKALNGLRASGEIRITGTGVKGSPKVVTMLHQFDFEDED